VTSCTFLDAQDLTALKDAKPIVINGGFNINATALGAQGTELNRDPFFWQLNANMNINFYGVVSLPFSITLTKENHTFNQPSFRQFGMSPNYKSVTLHLGYRNMSFSNYSLSGLTFFGTGIEVTPEKYPVKFYAMYGRFNKAVQFIDLDDLEEEDQVLEEPSYERRGFATKLTVGNQKHNADLILFKAFDLLESLKNDTLPDMKPQDNFVLGLNTHHLLFKTLNLDVEFTNSAYTADSRQAEWETESYKYLNYTGALFEPKISTQVKNAIVSKLGYRFTKADIALMYRRVDPDYVSLGTPGMIGDIEEYTVNLSTNLMKQKINLASSFGGQRDNLDNKDPQGNKRLIGSINMNYNVSEVLNISLNYSDFNAKILPVRISFSDSIKYVQITKNLSTNVNYKFGPDSAKHVVSFNANLQNANTVNRTLTDTLDTNTDLKNANLNYQLNLPEKELSFNVTLNYSEYDTETNKSISIGPSMSVSKNFFNKKLRSSFVYSYYFTRSTNSESFPVNNFGLSFGYMINKHHAFRLNARYLLKSEAESEMVHKYQAGFMYNFTF
jgi:hypothetical protein